MTDDPEPVLKKFHYRTTKISQKTSKNILNLPNKLLKGAHTKYRNGGVERLTITYIN